MPEHEFITKERRNRADIRETYPATSTLNFGPPLAATFNFGSPKTQSTPHPKSKRRPTQKTWLEKTLSGSWWWVFFFSGIIFACFMLGSFRPDDHTGAANFEATEKIIEPGHMEEAVMEDLPNTVVEHAPEPVSPTAATATLDDLNEIKSAVDFFKMELQELKEEMRRQRENSKERQTDRQAEIESLKAELEDELRKKYSIKQADGLTAELRDEISEIRGIVDDQNQKTNLTITHSNEKIQMLTSDFEAELVKFKKSLAEQADTIEAHRNYASDILKIREELASLSSNVLSSKTHEEQSNVGQWVDKKLDTYKADKTGMADFALESAGAEILPEFSTKGLTSNAAMIKLWSIPIIYNTMSPRIAIQPDVNPGNCFAFKGPEGAIGIQLSRQVIVQNVTVEHIPKEISLTGHIDSAPHEIQLYGIDANNEKKRLGEFAYDTNGLPIQTFRINNHDAWRRVQFQFLSNWGAAHTCIYRLRVHGAHPLN